MNASKKPQRVFVSIKGQGITASAVTSKVGAMRALLAILDANAGERRSISQSRINRKWQKANRK